MMPEPVNDVFSAALQSPVAAQPQPAEPEYRSFDDVESARDAIFNGVMKAMQNKYPISNQRYTLRVSDLGYNRPKKYNFTEQKKAITKGRTLGWGLHGRWELMDNKTGKVVDRSNKQLIMQVPYLTERGTMIFNGNEYTIASQMRLRPGIYTRVKDNGIIEAHFNVKGGTGPSFRVFMEPTTGIFRMNVGQANLKLYPIIKAMGYTDRDLEELWGRDLLHANVAASDPRAVQRAYQRLVRRPVAAEEQVKEAAYDYAQATESAPDDVKEEIQDFQAKPEDYKANTPLLYHVLGTGTPAYKMSKEDAQYTDESTVEGQTCGNCQFIYETVNGQYICSQVRGKVEKAGWCRLWKPAGAEEKKAFSLEGNTAPTMGKFSKMDVNYVQYGTLQQCRHCRHYGQDGPETCGQVQGHIAPMAWCVLWDAHGYKSAAEIDEQERHRVQFVGTIKCEEGEKGPWIYVDVHKGLPEAAYAALQEQEIECEPRFDNPHISVVLGDEAKQLVEKYGERNWKKACGHGRRVMFSLQNAMVDLNPETWDAMDRVWFLEVKSPQLRAFRKSLGLEELPRGKATGHEHQFHITVAVRQAEPGRGQSVLDSLFDDTESKTKAAFDKLSSAIKQAAYDVDFQDEAFATDLNADDFELSQRQAEGQQIAQENPAVGKARIETNLSAMLGEAEEESGRLKKEISKLPTRERAVESEMIDEEMETAKDEIELADGEEEEDVVKQALHALTASSRRSFESLIKQADDRSDQLRAVFEKMELDEDTTESTMGRRLRNVSPQVIVDATRKLIAVSNKQADTDDRDALAYQQALGPEDLFAERVAKDAGQLGRRLLWRATFQGKANNIPPGALSPQMRSVLLKSGLAAPLEEVNPLEIFDQLVRITRMGEGGMPSEDAVPDEARSVQPSHFGTIDPIRAPEGTKIGVDSRLTHRTYKGRDGSIYVDMFDIRNGKKRVVSAQEIAKSVVAFPGEFERANKRGSSKVRAMVHGKKMSFVPLEQVDFELPHSSHMFTGTANMVPMVSAIKGGRLLMGAKMSLSFDEEIIIRRAGQVFRVKIGQYSWQAGDESIGIDKQTKQVSWLPVRAKITHENECGMVRVVMKSGRAVVATDSHSFVTIGDDGELTEVCAGELLAGTAIPRAGRLDLPECNYEFVVEAGKNTPPRPRTVIPLDFEFGWVVGMYLAEGFLGTNNSSVIFAARTPELRKRLYEFFDSLCGLPDFDKQQFDRIRISWKALADKLRAEFRNGSHRKRLPDWCLAAPIHFREGIIAGYLAGDGSYELRRNRVRVKGGTRSQSLRDGLMLLLTTLGIDTVASTCMAAGKPFYFFVVRAEHVDWLPDTGHPQKEQRRRHYPAWSGKKSADWMPVYFELHQTILGRTERGSQARNRCYVQQHTRASVRELIGEGDTTAHQWLSSDVMWDQVKLVERLNAADYEEVYDLDLDDNVFLCGTGVFVHNSVQALPLQDAEAPLVQNLYDEGDNTSFEDQFGAKMGAIYAEPQAGVVRDIGNDYISVRYADGTTKKHNTYANFPFNRKSVSGDTVVYIRREGGAYWLGAIRDYTYADGDHVLSIDPETCLSSWLPVTGFIAHENDKKLLRITLASGRSFVVTEDHSLMVMGDDMSLTPAYPDQCVVDGTRLPVAAFPVEDGTDPLTVDEALLGGLYAAEGHIPPVQPNNITIAVAPDNRAGEVLELFRRLGCAPYRTGGRVCATSERLSRLLRQHFGHGATGKRISTEVLTASAAVRAAVIAGYFAGDGCLNADKHGAIQLYAFSVSQRLRDSLVTLLASFGIFCGLSERANEDKSENWNRAYGLRVVSEHIKRLDRWMFYTDREERLRELLAVREPRASKFEVVPVPRKARKLLYAQFEDVPHFIYKSATNGYIAKHRVEHADGVFGQWARSDVLWDKIIAIDEAPHEDKVYDFSVAGAEAFAVNGGVVVHNTSIHNTPAVKIGDQVQPGQLLAKSNFTDDKGTVAIGKNLRVGYLAWRGFNADDAIVISESAAQKLSSEHMYPVKYKRADDHEIGKRAFVSLYPGEFDKKQLETIGDDGVVKVGTKINFGDPLVLSVSKRKAKGRGVLRGRKNLFSSAAEVWDHHAPGVVTDVDKTKDGYKVFVKSYSPMNVADKLSNRYGGKGVVSMILPDDQMPHTADGKPLDITLSPLGIVSRVNPAQLIETALGKVARKTGKPYKLPGFTDGNWVDFAKRELARHGLSDTEDLYDPKTGRKIPNVLTGDTYMMKLHHVAEGKSSGRDIGSYTSEGLPAGGGIEGSKRIGMGELFSLVSHGASNLVRDAKVVRGQRNDDYWRALRLGLTPPSPKTPMVYDKFLAHLKGAGINLRKRGDKTHLFAMTDKDVEEMSSGAIKVADTVKGERLDPVEQGLFDAGLTGGHGGTRWSHLDLAEPMPNPVMEEPVRRLLGLTRKKFEAILAGEDEINGQTGSKAIANALEKMDVDQTLEYYEDMVKTGPQSKRDNAVKIVGYLRTMKEMGVKPRDLLMNKVPVLPPAFRPITSFNSMQMVSDPNFLYLDLMNANEDLRELKKELGDDVGEERLRLYKAFKAVSGLGDPVATKTQEKKVKGLLRSVFGSSPKLGLFQRRVLGAAVDTVGRGVITPNPNLNMDQVGLPEDKAWVIFRPFVIRNLVRRGMGAQAAARSVADQTAVAYKALLEEMNRRPVVINRAPVLHRYGMMAAWATPVKGSTLQIPPIVTPGFNADFDGNCLVGSSKIVLTFAANGRSLSSLAHIEEEYAMKFSKSSTIILVTDELTVVEAAIADVPIVAGSLQHDKNGAEVYAVPAGVRTLSYDDTTGRPVWKDVQRLTIERARETVRVSLRSGHAVICTPNESMAVYNHETGRLEKRAPADAVGSLCAIIREQPVVGGQGNFEHGWLLGAFVSDGFLMRGQSHVRIGYAKCDDAKRERFAAAVEAYEGGPVKRNTYRAIPGEKKLGRAVKDHYARAPRTLELFQRCYTAAPSGNIRAALLKTLPPLGMFNRETLLGILSGLLDGDGSLSVSNAKKQPQIMSNFSTSSPALVDSVRTLGRLLGLRVSATAYEPKEGRQQRHTAWIVTFSTVDLARLAPELRLTDSTGAALLKDLEAQELKDDRDIVPVPAAVMASATSKLGVLGEHEMRKSLCTIKSKTNPAYYVTRSFARKLLARFDAVQIDDEALQAALRQLEAVVAATSVGWSPIKTVEAAAVEDVYDLEIPDTKVFATNGGMIVWDTMNYHVPVSKEAVQDAIDKMLPSRNLKDTSAFDVHYYPRQEFLHGLHLASAAKKKGRPKTFVSREAALAAYERGEVSVDDPVVILGD